MYGGAAGLRKGGKEEGARKGGGRDTEERTKEKKREKRQDIVGGKQRGRILKRVKRATAKQRESKAAGGEEKDWNSQTRGKKNKRLGSISQKTENVD